MMNFSDAENQSDGETIPHNTVAPVSIEIKYGEYSDPANGMTNNVATKSDKSGSIYISWIGTVIAGPYTNRKIYGNMIGLYSPKGPKWGEMGRSFVKGILDSAKGLHPEDQSQEGIAARNISSYEDLNGMEFLALISEEEGDQGEQNRINKAITVNMRRHYAWKVGGQLTTPPPEASPPRKEKKTRGGGGSATPGVERQQWGQPGGQQPAQQQQMGFDQNAAQGQQGNPNAGSAQGEAGGQGVDPNVGGGQPATGGAYNPNAAQGQQGGQPGATPGWGQ